MTQNSGPTGRSARAASHGRSCSQPQASMPISRRRLPLPWRTSSDPRRSSRSGSVSASASWTRSPARQSTTISARPEPVPIVAGLAHRRNDLLHCGRVGRISLPLIPGNPTSVMRGQGRRRATPARGIENNRGRHGITPPIGQTVPPLYQHAPPSRREPSPADFRFNVAVRKPAACRPHSWPSSRAAVKATPTNASASRWESGSVTSAVRLPRSFRRDGVLTAEIVARGGALSAADSATGEAPVSSSTCCRWTSAGSQPRWSTRAPGRGRGRVRARLGRARRAQGAPGAAAMVADDVEAPSAVRWRRAWPVSSADGKYREDVVRLGHPAHRDGRLDRQPAGDPGLTLIVPGLGPGR
jgi:hypothetical protein